MARIPPNKLQIRNLYLIPTELNNVPAFPQDIFLDTTFIPTISQLSGINGTTPYLVGATSENCLKTASYGSGYHTYETQSGTAPDAYDDTEEIETTVLFHKVDVLVESNDAEIRISNSTTSFTGGNIIIPVGFYSVEFVGNKVEIQNRTAGSAATYQMVVWY